MAELKNIIRIAKADYDTLVADGSIIKSGTTYTYSPTTTLYIVEDGLDDTYVSLGGGGGKLLSDFATTATTTNLSNSISNETTARKNADSTINTTLANKADKSHTHSYLPLSGGTETGVIKSTFTSSTWINGVSNAALTLNNTGYSAAISMPTKNGRVSISSYASGDDKVYLGYASSAQINAGTNAFTNQLYWDASINNLVGKTFQSTATTGTAPLTIASTTKVENLNADLLDGCHASGLFTALSNNNSGLSLTIGGTTKSLTNLTASTCSGNAGSATKLQNARNINGTAFNGTGDITTTKWGTSRTIKGGVLDQLSFSTDGSADATITESTYGCYINSGNKANYPYHRIASIGPLTGSWLDNSAILLISQNYAGGNYGIVKIDVRTNYSAQTSTASAKWLIRQGFDSNQIIIGLNNVYGNTYADVFFYAKNTTYLRTYVKVLHAGSGISYKRTFDLYNSSEADSTTTTDSGKSVYCYSSISTAATALRSKAYTTIVSATTEGIAGSAESATTAGKAASADQLTNARNIQTNLASTSSASFNGTAGITPGVTGTLGVSNGGTGKNTLTSGAALIGNGTSAVTLRSITNNTSNGPLGWTSDIGTNLTTLNTIAYWNGAYTGTNSNLKYSTNGEIIGTNNISSQSVKYATTAGSANAVAWGNVTGKPSTFTPASHIHEYLPLSGGTVSGDVTFKDSKVVQLNTLKVPTAAGGSTYGAGTNGQVLKTNGTTVYWGSDNNTVYTHPTTSGNKHIPSGGSSGQILRWSADGTAVWGSDTDTHYTSKNIVGGTSTATTETTGLTNGNVYLNHIENGAKTSSHNIKGSGATTVTTDANGAIIIKSTDTNTVYTHPTHTAYSSGLYKISTNSLGHVTAATAVQKSDITNLGIPGSDTQYTHPTTSGNKHIPSGGSSGQILRWSADGTAVWGSDSDTHYTSKNIVGGTSTATTETTGLTNGNVYLNHIENGAKTSSHNIKGSGATTVTTDGSGAIIIKSTDTDTKYTHPTTTAYSSGLYKISTNSLGHVTAATAVQKSDITNLGIPGSDSDTHYESKTVVNNSTASTANTTTALANGMVYLNHVENGSVKTSHKIKGSGCTVVETDTSGNILINSFDGHCFNGATASALTATVSGFELQSNTQFILRLAVTNEKQSLLTLNVNGLGAKNIYLNGTITSANNYGIPAGTYLVKYYNDAFYIRTDGKYTGDITGYAASATSATNDGNGNTITSTYIKGLSVNGQTITYTKGNNTTGTITTQDTKYSLPTASDTVLGGIKVGTNLSISNGVLSAKDTTYNVATTSSNGIMSTSQVSMLNSSISGVTQSNSTNSVTTTYHKNDGTTYYSTISGSNITVNYTGGSNTTIGLSLTKANVTNALGYTPPTTNTTYSVATTSNNGLMSSTDKKTVTSLQGNTFFDRQFTASVQYQPLFQVTLGTISSLGGKNPTSPGIIEFEIEVLGGTYITATYRGVLYVPPSSGTTPTITWLVKSYQEDSYKKVINQLLYDRTNNRLLFYVDSSSSRLTNIYTRTYIYQADHCTVVIATATTIGDNVIGFDLYD